MPDYGNLYDENGVQVRFNSHSLELGVECLRKYHYVQLEGWREIDENVHLRFGHHYARGMQTFFLARMNGADRKEALLLTVREAMVKTWDHELTPEGERIPGTGKPWMPDHVKNRFTLIRSLIWYFSEYVDDYEVLVVDGKPAVEIKIEVDIGDGLSLLGTLDRAIKYEGSPALMDQKTTGWSIGASYMKQWDMSGQMSQYIFLGQVALPEYPPKSILIDAAEIRVGFTRYGRGITSRSPSEIEEFLDDTRYHIAEMQKATRERHFPKRTTSCNNYGGCVFRDICRQAPEIRPNLLRTNFRKEKK